jgi:monofunctional glycosyltransferase
MLKSNEPSRPPRLLLTALLFVGVSLGGLAFYWLMAFPDVSVLAGTNPSTTALMQARMRESHHPKKPYWIWVPLSRISFHLQRAVIAAEDASFYRHEGFDWVGIKNAAADNLQVGRMKKGGSTITQQLAKNLYLSSEKTLFRKAREALIARSLEHQLTKRRILELYLNVVEWGRGVYGAEAASRHHFGKSAKDLTADEAALLAAVLPAPRQYDPLRMTRYLSIRQQQILRWMGGKAAPPATIHGTGIIRQLRESREGWAEPVLR